jgi:hypothetical protein
MGLKPREAAQIAANMHADYANVPAKIRRNLNLAAFTPTFTISMVRSELRAMAELTKIAGRLAKKPFSPKTKVLQGKINSAFARSVIYMTMGLLTYHTYMTMKGWEIDVFGQKYHKKVNIPGEGEVVFSKPTPIGKSLNIAMKIINVFKAGNRNKPAGIMRVLRNFSTPVLRVGSDLIDNRQPGGGSVYKTFDPWYTQMLDATDYTIQNTFRILKAHKGLLPDMPKRDREKVLREMSTLLKALDKAGFGYTHVRKSERVTQAAKINGLVRQYQREAKELAGADITPREQQQRMRLWRKDLDKRIKAIQKGN